MAEEFGFTVEFVSAELQEAVREEEDDADEPQSTSADRHGHGTRRPR
ncbi:MAG: hypothetical protein MZV63_42800 [Marinilabiliales bacterium]|nr:hypothetical protein [Marinilabiliales bacterium]